MSASVAPSTPVPVPTTAPPQDNNNNNREWLLPMPINDTADSFARDLIDQFDKRHSQLREELVNVHVVVSYISLSRDFCILEMLNRIVNSRNMATSLGTIAALLRISALIEAVDKVALAALEVATRVTITTLHQQQQQHIIVAIVMAKP